MLKNTRIISIGIVVSFLAVMLANFLYHCQLMGNVYEANMSLFRDAASTKGLYPLHILATFMLVSISALMFAKGYEKKGYMEGLRFGLLIAIILCSQTLVGYVYSPIPTTFLRIWLVGNILQGVVIGLSLAMVFGMKLDEASNAKKAKPAKAKKSKKK